MMPEDNPTLEYPCDPGLGSLRSVAPNKVTADRWDTTSGHVFPSMDPLAMSAWNAEREVWVPQPKVSLV